ncbi:MAG: DUF512 domain-containing protein [Bacillota bacterium]
MATGGARVETVEPGGIAEEVGIEPGDVITAVNGRPLQDLIDFRFLSADENIELEIVKNNGEIWDIEIEKDIDEDLGLTFAEATFDRIRPCANKCVFCFVDQMPVGMRETLYIKDDDYRLSFLQGNFVTLTNLKPADMERILRLRLSPLYVSVHTTNPELRQRMLGSRNAGKIMDQLRQLAVGGISFHTQIVLCPGYNDGAELDRTISDLASLWPAVLSIAVVPVGLTKVRADLPALHMVTPDEAGGLIARVRPYQDRNQNQYGEALVYLADEIYLLAGAEIPPAEFYAGFPQLENGVGLTRVFYDSFYAEAARLPEGLAAPKRVTLVTGVSGAMVLKPVAERLNRLHNLTIVVKPIINRFFGETVTVAGLLTGQDVVAGLKGQDLGDLVLIPSVMFKRDQEVFLDGMTPGRLAEQLGTRVEVVDLDQGARDFINKLLD